jgi:chromosomal replication initiator protein
VELNDVLSARRTGNLIIPRQVSMYLAKEMTGLSYPQIGRGTGGRDHSTVVHAHRKIEGLIKTNKRLASQVAQIMGLLG